MNIDKAKEIAQKVAEIDEATLQLSRFNNTKEFCRITLNGMDLYDMQFFKSKGIDLIEIHKKEGLYNDMLQSTFTEVTKLYTKL